MLSLKAGSCNYLILSLDLGHFQVGLSVQGCLELHDFIACKNLRFSSESICKIPAIG